MYRTSLSVLLDSPNIGTPGKMHNQYGGPQTETVPYQHMPMPYAPYKRAYALSSYALTYAQSP